MSNDGITVITLDVPPPPPPGEVIGVDVEQDTPVVVTWAAPDPVAATVVTVPAGAVVGGGGDAGAALSAHIADTTPHPAYDDLPSLALIFQNGLV